MRIGVFSWETLYSIKIGEIAPHVSKLSEALTKRGHEMHIFTRRGDFDAYDLINEVHYHRVAIWNSGDITMQMDDMCDALIESFEIAQDNFGKFDVIHGHDWHPIRALNRIKSDHDIQYILTLHSTEWGRNGNYFGNGISGKISHREWLGGYESHQIIVTKKRMKDEIMQIYSIPEQKIIVIPNRIMGLDAKSHWDNIALKTEEVYDRAQRRSNSGRWPSSRSE